MKIKNAFTGEELMNESQKTALDKAREPGLKLKALHDAELEPFGERGEFRPKSRGAVYDIPPTNGTYCPDQVDLTGQSATDINQIMKRIDPDGKRFNQAVAQGLVTDAGMRYDDFTTMEEFQEAHTKYAHAIQQFETLPVELRNRFENNPAKFLDYIHDEKHREEQYNLGIRVRPPKKEPETTLKDVVGAIRENQSTASKPKKAPGNEE